MQLIQFIEYVLDDDIYMSWRSEARNLLNVLVSQQSEELKDIK